MIKLTKTTIEANYRNHLVRQTIYALPTRSVVGGVPNVTHLVISAYENQWEQVEIGIWACTPEGRPITQLAYSNDANEVSTNDLLEGLGLTR